MINIFKSRKFFQIKLSILFTFVFLDILFLFTQPFDKLLNELYFIHFFDRVTCLILFMDLIVLYKHSNEKLVDFIKNHFLDILASIPIESFYFRIFIIFRILKLLKLYKVFNLSNKNRQHLRENILYLIITFTLIYFIIISVFLGHYDYGFNNMIQSLWFDVVTISSVGYGDFVPLKFISKVITLFSMIVGVLLLSIFTAYLTSCYNENPEAKKREFVIKYIKNLGINIKRLEDKFSKIDNNFSQINKDVDYINNHMDEIIELLKK